MPPRKMPEKASSKKVEQKPKNGVKKKTETAKPLIGIRNESNNCDAVPANNTRRKCLHKNNQNETNMLLVNNVPAGQASPPVLENVPTITTEKVRPVTRGIRGNVKLLFHTRATAKKTLKPDHTTATIEKPTASLATDGSTCLQSHNDIKIMLANEVIYNAFKKKPTMVKPTRLVRLKKVTTKSDKNGEMPNNSPENTLKGQDVAKKKVVKRDCCRKRTSALLKENPQQLDTATSKSSMEKIPKRRRNLSLKRNTINPVNSQSVQNTDPVEEVKCGMNKTEKVENNTTLADSVSYNSEIQSMKPNNVSLRKNSGTSTSTCFSWTKDISSSSTTTCITVNTNDFVRIDKKLPIVKLINVDSKMNKKDSSDNIFEENCFDNHQEGASMCSSISISNLNISQSLQLSTSSLTSVTTNRTAAQNISTSFVNHQDIKINKLQRSIENLSSKMKNFDVEMINWIGYNNESEKPHTKNIHAKLFKFLKEENEVIRYCKEVARVLIGDKYEQSSEKIEGNVNGVERTAESQADVIKNDYSKGVADDSDKRNIDTVEVHSDIKRTVNINNINDRDDLKIINERKSFDEEVDVHDNDDEDALSLFAESLTGLESSRINSSYAVSVTNVAVNDKSVRSDDVGKEVSPDHFKALNNVEKQKADSSSVRINSSRCNINSKFETGNNKEFTNYYNSFSDRFKVRSVSGNVSNNFNGIQSVNRSKSAVLNTRFTELINEKSRSTDDVCQNSNGRSSELQNYTGRTFEKSNHSANDKSISNPDNFTNARCEFERMTSNLDSVEGTENNSFAIRDVEQFKQPTGQQLAMTNKNLVCSSIFKSVCIFNLISNCKNAYCTYPHTHLDRNFVKSQLQDMTEELFIRELMYVLKWPILKRVYGMCFLEECIRRNLTVWLLELVKSFLMKNKYKQSWNSAALLVEVTETALLHLNDANMEEYADLLRWQIRPNTCMCDYFLEAISGTQNFSRFKQVFIKLTIFMSKIRRSFRLEVATQVLERLCILPYDEALARTLLEIIEKTNPSILNTPMMRLLEKQLWQNNSVLYEKLMCLKQQAEGFGMSVVTPPTQSPHIAPSVAGYQTSSPIVRADSPDTTNMDFMNYNIEPVTSGTITINRTFNTSSAITSVGTDSSDEHINKYVTHKHDQRRRYYPPPLLSQRLPKLMYKRPGFQPRSYTGTPSKFRHKLHKEPF